MERNESLLFVGRGPHEAPPRPIGRYPISGCLATVLDTTHGDGLNRRFAGSSGIMSAAEIAPAWLANVSYEHEQRRPGWNNLSSAPRRREKARGVPVHESQLSGVYAGAPLRGREV